MGLVATTASGLLLGSAICLTEVVEQPLSGASAASIVEFLSSLAPMWWFAGVGWAIAARLAEPRFSRRTLFCVWVAVAITLTFASDLLDSSVPIYDHDLGLSNDARLVHILWMNLFYGSIYLTGYVAARRAVRSRRMLAGVRQSREESSALLAESRLHAMRRQLQPQTILDALDTLRRLYPTQKAGADELVDVLVGFLRPAVRSLAGDTATLAGELDLAHHYLQLRAIVGEAEPPFTAISNPPPPACEFPPRLLMPIVESLCLTGARLVLTGFWRGADYHVVLTADGIEPELAATRLEREIAPTASQWRHAFASEVCAEKDHLSWTLIVPSVGRGETLEMHA